MRALQTQTDGFRVAKSGSRGRCQLSVIAGAMAAAVQVGTARASVESWTNTAGGNWETTGNWSAGQIPTLAGTDAWFNTASGIAYTVSMPGQEKATSVNVQNNTVTFDSTNNMLESLEISSNMNVNASAGQTTSVTLQGNGGYGVETDYGNFSIGGAGTTYFTDNGVPLTDDGSSFLCGPGSTVVINSTLQAKAIAVQGNAYFSTTARSFGNITIGGPAATGALLSGTISSTAGNLYIGSGGIGTFNGGGSIDTNIYIGNDSAGTWNVAASSSGESVYVGTSTGTGAMNISNATLNIYALFQLGSNGTVNLGTGGLLSAGIFNLSAGTFNFNAGTLKLLTGGTISVPRLTIPATGALEGAGTINGSVTNLGMLQGTASSYMDGTFIVDGNYNQSAGATLQIPWTIPWLRHFCSISRGSWT
jgi:hypothetical protein